MGILFALLAFILLPGVNTALGYSFFSSGMVPASLLALATGWGYAKAVHLLTPPRSRWTITSRVLRVAICISLLISILGLSQVMKYSTRLDLDPANDMEAQSAAGKSLFLLQALGMAVAYRGLKPQPSRRLTDLAPVEIENSQAQD